MEGMTTVRRLKFACLLLNFLGTVTRGGDVVTIHLQKDSIPSAESRALFNGTLPDMEFFSICSFMKILRGRTSFDSLVSYAVPQNFNELYIGFYLPPGYFSVWQNMDELFFGKIRHELLEWNRFCYVHDLRSDRFKLWWNEEFVEGVSHDVDKIRGGGIFVLGQDQDDMDGGYNADQSIHAIIGGFRLYDNLLNEDDALNYVNCIDTIAFTPVLDFSDIENDWIFKGSIEAGMESTEEICSDEKGFHLTFPEPRDFSEMVQFCNISRGTIIVPRDSQENQALIPSLMEYSDVCKEASGWASWIGVKKNSTSGLYYNYYTEEEIKYQNPVSTLSMHYYDCAALMASVGIEGKWGWATCDSPVCGICDYEETTKFKMRGLCANTAFDSIYLLFGYRNRKPNLRGFYYSDLYWNNSTWTLTFLKDLSIYAEMINSIKDQYPFGKKDWRVFNDKCSSDSFEEKQISFTACEANEFTCDNGHCIRIDQRCDLFPQCSDQSDEIGCDIIVVPESYIKVLPPPPIEEQFFQVSVGMSVTSIRSFSLIDLTISYDLTISFKWRDARLTYAHLKEGVKKNQVSFANQGQIWTPGFFLENESGSKVSTTDFGTKTFVDRNSPPIEDNTERLKEDQLFLGKENFITQEIILATTFQCQFDLGLYPFDTQKCRLILKSTQGKHSVRFEMDFAEFLGERRLLEYQVDEVYSEATIEGDYSQVNFVMTFYNLFKYYIFGTYIPTLLIVIITYLTFYFPLYDFTDRIMVSLTALMVLAALFLQTSQGVARTSYIKVIDVWFISCMVFNFTIIVTLVFLNFFLENSRLQPVTKVTPISSPSFKAFEKGGPRMATDDHDRIVKHNLLMRIIFPSVAIFFTFIYFAYILTNYNPN